METPNTKLLKDAAIAGWSPSSIFAAFSNNVDSAVDKKRSSDFTPITQAKVIDTKVTPLATKIAFNVLDIENLTKGFSSQSLNNKENIKDASIDLDRLVIAAMLEEPLCNGWNLFDHQKDAVINCLKSRRSILAYDMGLGKTVIGLKYAPAMCTVYPNCILIVISPCTLIENWKREGEMVGFVEINERRAVNAKLKMMICSWAKMPSIQDIIQHASSFVIVADEAHAMQTYTSKRTKSILDLCRHSLCLGTLLSTGMYSHVFIRVNKLATHFNYLSI